MWQLIQFGNGFTFTDVYTMPTKWRNFYYNKLVKLKKEEEAEVKKTTNQNSKVNIRR